MPLYLSVLRELRKSGAVTDKELYRAVKSAYGVEISFSEFNKALMVLELRGLIAVEPLRKGLRMVRLLQKS